jgi:hypothetical protein
LIRLERKLDVDDPVPEPPAESQTVILSILSLLTASTCLATICSSFSTRSRVAAERASQPQLETSAW